MTERLHRLLVRAGDSRRRHAVLGEPPRDSDLLGRVVPVGHRSRDPNHDRNLRKMVDGVLAKPQEGRLRTVQTWCPTRLVKHTSACRGRERR
jgi:hypothetical protein